MIITIEEFIDQYKPCGWQDNTKAAAELRKYKTLEEAWHNISRADWLFWALAMVGYRNHKAISLATLSIAKTVEHLIISQKTKNVLQAVEDYWLGKITKADVGSIFVERPLIGEHIFTEYGSFVQYHVNVAVYYTAHVTFYPPAINYAPSSVAYVVGFIATTGLADIVRQHISFRAIEHLLEK